MAQIIFNSEVYAIRQKSTGLFLPQRRTRGFSNDEPSTFDRPRLHYSKKAAKQALQAWLKGKWIRSGGQDYFGEWNEDVKIIKQENRKIEDMEIVIFSLQEQYL